MPIRNHDIIVTCPHCGHEFDLRRDWPTCPHCGANYENDKTTNK